MISTRRPPPDGAPAAREPKRPRSPVPIWRSWRFWLQWTVTAALVAAIAFSVDFEDAWRVIRGLQPGWLVVGVAFLIASNFVHTVKWQRLLQTVGHVSLRDLFAVFWSSMATNNVIPFRAGDVLRVQVLAQRCRLPRSGIVASLLTERVLDGVSFAILLALGLLLVSGSAGQFYLIAFILTAVVLAALIATALLAQLEVRPGLEEHRILGRLPHGPRRLLDRFLPDFVEGLKPLGRLDSGLETAGLALAAWVLEVFAFAAFGFALGLDIDPAGYLLVMVAVNVAGSLTILPSNLGVYEFAAISILQATGATSGEATAYAFGSHLIVILTISGVGVLTLAYLRVGPQDILYFRQQPPRPKTAAAERPK